MSAFPLLVIVKEDKGRDGKKVQKVDTDGKTHQKGYKDNPSVGIRLVSLLVPLGHRPEDQGCDKRRHRVNLTLDCREPECIAKSICKGTHRSRSEDSNRFSERVSSFIRRL